MTNTTALNAAEEYLMATYPDGDVPGWRQGRKVTASTEHRKRRMTGPCNKSAHKATNGCWHKPCEVLLQFRDGSYLLRTYEGLDKKGKPYGFVRRVLAEDTAVSW